MSVIQHTSVIILAAGKGTRLNAGRPSEIPKVMHRICGRPMLEYTLETLKKVGFEDIVPVIGYKAELIKDYFGPKYKYAIQPEQKGTGHAVICAENFVDKKNKYTLVIQGDDSAFYRPETIANFVKNHDIEKAKVSLLTLRHPKPAELGRIIRDKDGRVVAIKEKEVLTEEEKKIREINTATYCFDSAWLWENLPQLKPSATGKGELILPDLIKLAVEQGEKVYAHLITRAHEWVGVNTPEQLEYANQAMAERLENGY